MINPFIEVVNREYRCTNTSRPARVLGVVDGVVDDVVDDVVDGVGCLECIM